MNLAMIDFIFIGLIALFMIRCYLRGFITEILSMAAVVLGIIAALYFFRNGAVFLREKFLPDTKAIHEILAFIGIFVIVFLFFKFIEGLLKGIVQGVRLGGVDRFLGIMFGFGEGLVVVSLILFIINIQPLFDSGSLLSDSFFAGLLLPLITGMGNSKSV
ncbi:MAG: CvpA family protein [Treponema sp.]|nr:CvpA family protein [Treponema sp.]